MTALSGAVAIAGVAGVVDSPKSVDASSSSLLWSSVSDSVTCVSGSLGVAWAPASGA